MQPSFRHALIGLFALGLGACVDQNPPRTVTPLTPKPPAVAAPVDPNLTHRYSFTDGAKDSVGKIDGILKGSATISGGKLVLDNGTKGSGDATLSYLEIPSPILPASGSASIAVWFSSSASATFAPRLLDIGDRSGIVGNAFLYFAPHFTNTANFRAAITATTTAARTFLDGPRLDDSQPHFVVIVLDNTQMHVFVDGKEPAPAVDLGNNTLANVRQVHTWFGRSGFDQDAGLNGSIDEIRIYNTALTLADAAALAKAGPDVVVPTAKAAASK